MDLRKVVFGVAPLVLVMAASPVLAETYGIGRAPTAEELAAASITIQPDGTGLPAGHGDAKTGAQLFIDKGCSGCHGDEGVGGLVSAPELKSAKGPEVSPWERGVMPAKVPNATILWDFIHRAMPLGDQGSLTADEVYSLTAYLFAINGVIPEDTVLDQDSLPKLKMPIGDNWGAVPTAKADYDPKAPRLADYPY
jgi:cytochrome c